MAISQKWQRLCDKGIKSAIKDDRQVWPQTRFFLFSFTQSKVCWKVKTSESLYLCSSGGNRGPEVDVCGRPAPFIHFRFYIKKKLTGKNEIASLTLRPSLEYRARWYRRNAASLRRPNARRSDPSVHQSSIDLACCNSGYDPIKDSFMEHILLCLHRFWLDSLEWQGLSF